MTDYFWERLFFSWCLSYDNTRTPEHLKDNPVQAYGEYAFREGVRLGLLLAFGTFTDET